MKTSHPKAFVVVLLAVLLATGAWSQGLPGEGLSRFLPANGDSLGISPFAAEAPVTDMPDLGPAPAASTFLGFQSKTAFHRFSGWMSGGLLLAAGIVGGIHTLDMMNRAHSHRNGEDDFDPDTCGPIVASVYDSSTSQTLRWTHVGLLAAGETFYIANGITGSSLMGRLEPGWNPPRIHRYAFFAHLGLMVTEGVLGFMLTDALQRQDHELFTGLAVAHAGIGIAIPVVILGAGVIMKDY